MTDLPDTQRVPSHAKLQSNESQIAAKLVGGEVILVNIENGTYYSIQGVGARMWARLTAGHTVAETAADIASTYGIPAEQADDDLQAFLASTLTEGLLCPPRSNTWLSHDDDDLPSVSPYQPAMIERFTDMNELLALDPPMPNLSDLQWEAPDAS